MSLSALRGSPRRALHRPAVDSARQIHGEIGMPMRSRFNHLGAAPSGPVQACSE
jgi:hypothetical protein